MKKYFKWAGYALGLYLIFAVGMIILQQRYAPTPGYLKAQGSEELKNKKLNYTLNGVDLEIPLAYIAGRVPKEGKQTGVRLIATINDIQPLKEPEGNFFDRNEVEKLLRIMIQGLDRPMMDFQKWASSPRSGILAQSYAGKEYGLEKYNDGIPESSRRDFYYYPSEKNRHIYKVW